MEQCTAPIIVHTGTILRDHPNMHVYDLPTQFQPQQCTCSVFQTRFTHTGKFGSYLGKLLVLAWYYHHACVTIIACKSTILRVRPHMFALYLTPCQWVPCNAFTMTLHTFFAHSTKLPCFSQFLGTYQHIRLVMIAKRGLRPFQMMADFTTCRFATSYASGWR